MRHAKVIDHEPDDSEINLTPLLDVVFIMLIFFIVTSTFIRETGIPATPAEPGSAVGEVSAILVLIGADDAVWVDDRRTDSAALRAAFAWLHALDADRPVLVEPADDSSTQALVRVIDAAMQAGITDIAVTGN